MNPFETLFRNPFEAPASDVSQKSKQKICGYAVFICYRMILARKGETLRQQNERRHHEFGHKLITGFKTQEEADAWAKVFHKAVDAHTHSVTDHRGLSNDYFEVKILDMTDYSQHSDPEAYALYLMHEDPIIARERKLRINGATCRTCN